MSPVRIDAGRAHRAYGDLYSCGDIAVIERKDCVQLFCVIDALGHGPDAQRSAEAAAAAARAALTAPLCEIFSVVDRSLRGLRGVVMAAVKVDGVEARFAGVGNVELFSPPGQPRPISMPGTLGSTRFRFREFALNFVAGQRWVLASDGIRAREGAILLEQLRAEPAQRAAQLLIEGAGRRHDDVCALILDVEGAS